jgi:hypothetical protein
MGCIPARKIRERGNEKISADFSSKAAAKKHERAIQYFKHH